MFPHHENEIAQTVAGRGRPLARLWMHNGMLEAAEGEKMAKSVGNIRGLAEVLDEVGGETLVLLFSTGHYRQPLAFTPESLEAAGNAARRIREAGRRLVRGESPAELAPHRDAFFDALADDFNTAKALPALYEWIGEANKRPEGTGDGHLREMLGVLGPRGAARGRGRPAAGGGRAGRPARRGARGQGLGRGRPPARRAARPGLGGARRPAGTGARPGVLTAAARGGTVAGTRRRATTSPPAPGRTVIYGRNAVREALRGRRRVHRIWATEAAAGEGWAGAPLTSSRRRRGRGARADRTPTRACARRSTRTRMPTPPSCWPRPSR